MRCFAHEFATGTRPDRDGSSLFYVVAAGKLDPDLKDRLSNGLNYLGHDLKVESFMIGKTCGKRGSRP